jgi:hypothetical protein
MMTPLGITTPGVVGDRYLVCFHGRPLFPVASTTADTSRRTFYSYTNPTPSTTPYFCSKISFRFTSPLPLFNGFG